MRSHHISSYTGKEMKTLPPLVVLLLLRHAGGRTHPPKKLSKSGAGLGKLSEVFGLELRDHVSLYSFDLSKKNRSPKSAVTMVKARGDRLYSPIYPADEAAIPPAHKFSNLLLPSLLAGVPKAGRMRNPLSLRIENDRN
mmetsp:Transcript_16574/g.23201  ORF Transcript_16574/g.23201 Transcript_16574/m.23201 type:complete len:139 (-) Transcript_16574:50-466(-)